MMKKIILTLTTFAVVNSISAQVDNNLIEAQKKATLDAIIKTDQNVLKTPTKPKPWLERAIAYLDLASFPDSTVSLKDLEASFKALDYISEAIKLDTREGEKGAIAKEAEVLITGNNTSKAYSAFMNMGVIKYQGKDYLSSFRYMSKASELAPNDTTSAMYTGVIAQLCEKNAEARKGYEYYISIGGKDVAIIYGLAQIYKVAKEEDAALSMIDKGIGIYPSNTDLRNERFNMLISFNRLDDAIKLLEKDINYGINDFKSMYNLTQLYIMNREDKKAKELQDKIISLYGIDKWEKAIENKDGRWEEEVSKTAESSPKQKEQVNNIITEEKKEFPVVAKENISPKEEVEMNSKIQEKTPPKEEITVISKNDLEPSDLKEIRLGLSKTYGLKTETTKLWTSLINLQKNFIIEKINFISGGWEQKEGHFPISYVKPNQKVILIWNDTKEKIIDSEFEIVESIGFNTWLVQNSIGRKGIINEKGEIIVPLEFSAIEVLDGIKDIDILEPQIFKCIKESIYNYTFPKPFTCKILTRQGKELANSNLEIEDIDLKYFTNSGKLYTVFIYNHTKDESYLNKYEFSICEYGDLPKNRFNGEYTDDYKRTPLNEFLKLYNPIVAPIRIGEINTGKNRPGVTKLFDLNKLIFITEVPNFVDVSIYSSPKKNELRIINENYIQCLISDKFKVLIPFIAKEIEPCIPIKDLVYWGVEVSPNKFLDSLYILKGINRNKAGIYNGIYKIGSGIILESNIIKELYTLSQRYILLETIDNTYNIFDTVMKKMALSRNYDRIGIKKEDDEFLMEARDTWDEIDGFVDCIFEGKSERISLPK